MTYFSRNLPRLAEEFSTFESNYLTPVIIETPETALAKQDSAGYLKALREKIKMDHHENLVRIQSNHMQVMKSMQHQSLDNYVSGLNSEDRLKIKQVEVLPYVFEKTIFGKRKADGVTLKVEKL
jgi:hypothetical protein